jgi:hypothetical protein
MTAKTILILTKVVSIESIDLDEIESVQTDVDECIDLAHELYFAGKAGHLGIYPEGTITDKLLNAYREEGMEVRVI